MAIALTIGELRSVLANPEEIAEREFDVVKNIAVLAGDPARAGEARELVLRALEHRDMFKATRLFRK